MSDRDYMRADWDMQQPRNPFWAMIPGTKGLIIGLVVVHLLMEITRNISIDAWMGIQNTLRLHPEFVFSKFQIWQFFTAGLLHNDAFHLLFNCIGIFYFGRLVEQRLGLKRFLVFALGTTISASFLYLGWALVRDDVTPMLGASGAVMGMVALAALWYPTITVHFLGLIPVQLWVLAVVFILLDVFGALREAGGVAHTAHLGGALYGWLYYRYAEKMTGVFGAIDRYVDEKKRKKEHRALQREKEMRAELDRILDKVNRDGMSALSDAEKKFLKQASDRLRG